VLLASEAHAEGRDGQQIGDDNYQIDRMDAHSFLGCPEKSALTVAQALSTAQYVHALRYASLTAGARF
jgi:hypothetical protein